MKPWILFLTKNSNTLLALENLPEVNELITSAFTENDQPEPGVMVLNLENNLKHVSTQLDMILSKVGR